MKFIKKFKSTLIATGIIAIALIIGFYSQNPINTTIAEPTPTPVTQTPVVEILEEEKPIEITAEPAKTPSAPLETKEPQGETLSCTLLVRCDTVLNNIENLAPEKVPLVPENGVILPETEIEFSDGDTVFDILKNELKNRGIHLEFNQVSVYDSAYIEGIGNLYEFDCGDLSGWIYRVNGKVPSMGCSLYKLQNGDKIEFLYTCNMGRDL
ncbi:MAG: DUF4430 domain-containing protein [Clostridia bacterium]|nr:DUF4430 domain-containing protein [Clostridia bacterium]